MMMPSVNHYIVVCETVNGDAGTVRFMVECNQMIDQGWKPQGGVASAADGAKVHLFQAFVRPTADEKRSGEAGRSQDLSVTDHPSAIRHELI